MSNKFDAHSNYISFILFKETQAIFMGKGKNCNFLIDFDSLHFLHSSGLCVKQCCTLKTICFEQIYYHWLVTKSIKY